MIRRSDESNIGHTATTGTYNEKTREVYDSLMGLKNARLNRGGLMVCLLMVRSFTGVCVYHVLDLSS